MKENQSETSNRYPSEDEDFWRQHQAAFSASGATKKAYCRRHQINYDRFSYWIKKLSGKPVAATMPTSMTPLQVSGLLPVQLKSPARQGDSSALCTISLRNGSMLSIHDERALLVILERWA